jgi:hypothetical protein
MDEAKAAMERSEGALATVPRRTRRVDTSAGTATETSSFWKMVAKTTPAGTNAMRLRSLNSGTVAALSSRRRIVATCSSDSPAAAVVATRSSSCSARTTRNPCEIAEGLGKNRHVVVGAGKGELG